MLELATDFKQAQFDVVLCFGNTLVHLQTLELIQQMLTGVFTILETRRSFSAANPELRLYFCGAGF
jgi:hypothetical protein